VAHHLERRRGAVGAVVLAQGAAPKVRPGQPERQAVRVEAQALVALVAAAAFAVNLAVVEGEVDARAADVGAQASALGFDDGLGADAAGVVVDGHLAQQAAGVGRDLLHEKGVVVELFVEDALREGEAGFFDADVAPEVFRAEVRLRQEYVVEVHHAAAYQKADHQHRPHEPQQRDAGALGGGVGVGVGQLPEGHQRGQQHGHRHGQHQHVGEAVRDDLGDDPDRKALAGQVGQFIDQELHQEQKHERAEPPEKRAG
jgi:hypothetical protein